MKQLKTIVAAALIVPTLALGLTAVLPGANVSAQSGGKGLNEYRDVAKPNDVPTDLAGKGGVITQVINFLLFAIGIISVVMIIVGGIRYTTSNGDSNKVTAAKNTVMYAVIGLVIAIFAYAIVNFVVEKASTNS